MIGPMVTALRRIGVRTLVLHKGDYAWLMDYEPAPIIALIDEDRQQVTGGAIVRRRRHARVAPGRHRSRCRSSRSQAWRAARRARS